MHHNLTLICLLFLTACNMVERLSMVGDTPQLTHIQNPTQLQGYQPISMPMPVPRIASDDPSPSLWQTGAQAFFKDQRAGKVGDIITVVVNMDQKEKITVNPTINQSNTSTDTVNTVLGLEKPLRGLFPKTAATLGTPSGFLNLNSSMNVTGQSQYDITDKINVRLAATVVQILPNGNMVIDGRQEIRLVNEVREIMIKGIVRREDIMASNTIHWDKISELRVAYGGRGDLTDTHEIPWGQQIYNRVMPF